MEAIIKISRGDAVNDTTTHISDDSTVSVNIYIISKDRILPNICNNSLTAYFCKAIYTTPTFFKIKFINERKTVINIIINR